MRQLWSRFSHEATGVLYCIDDARKETIMDDMVVGFAFEPVSENSPDAQLKMDAPFKGQKSELTGKEAEKLWEKILEIVDEFPHQGPTIVFTTTER